MRPSIRPLLGAAFAVLCLAGPSRAGHLDEFDASFTAAPRSATASALVKAAADPTIARIARVQTTDERYDVPAFVWGERRVVSVANLTRADGLEFIALAAIWWATGLRSRLRSGDAGTEYAKTHLS